MVRKNQTFYFADGKKVSLTPREDMVAYSTPGEENLSGSLIVSKKDSKAAATPTKSRSIEPQFPVYSSDSSGIIVALPEVRVQERTNETSAKFNEWLSKNKSRAEIVERKYGQTVVRPVSGKGEDAIAIANEIYVAIKPAMSQPRFVRILDRPDVTDPNENARAAPPPAVAAKKSAKAIPKSKAKSPAAKAKKKATKKKKA